LALIDCCVRHPSFEAADMLVATDMLLVQAYCEPFLAAALTDPAAATELASALVSLLKRAAVFIKAAGALPARSTLPQLEAVDMAAPINHAEAVAARLFERAAVFFPAAAPALAVLAGQFAHSVQQLVMSGSSSEGQQADGCSPEQTDGDSSSSQSRASAALLAVLLARSAVLLADAMDAAAAAAGITPAQLSAR
jgi:hypothetical protein